MADEVKRIVVLGATGSIGQQTLEIVRAFRERFQVVGLSGWRNQELLLRQAWEFRPRLLFCHDACDAAALPPGCRLARDLEELASHPEVDLVVLALVGTVGLQPALQAIRAGKQVALANKEPLVMAGELLVGQASTYGAQLLPIDSEPSAIWQCLQGEDAPQGVECLILTASGGPFRTRPLKELDAVTPEEALQHPVWRMGAKITVDSATLMNKAFEVIEAHWLFAIPWERIQVVIHPQSIIHSMVAFVDGSVKAQLAPPDMRLPIQYALFYPERVPNAALPRFDPLATGALTFEPVDPARYPCYSLALEAARAGGTYPAVLSAADEAAVELFLERRITFTAIYRLVARVLERHQGVAHPSLEEVLAADTWAREAVYREAQVRP